jgi:hypothetical protein
LEGFNPGAFTVGLGSAGRKGAVNQGGLFFGRMDGGNKFLSGIKNQGYTDINSFLGDLNKYTFGEELGSGLNSNSNFQFETPEKFNDSNIWTKAGGIAQLAGAATIGYGLASGAMGAGGAAAGGGSGAVGATNIGAGLVPNMATFTPSTIAGGGLAGSGIIAPGAGVAMGSGMAAGGASSGATSMLGKILSNSDNIMNMGEGIAGIISANKQQKALKGQMGNLDNIMSGQADRNNPFTKRALDFYDEFEEGGELPQRYKTILDYVTQASERKGVAQHGGTSQMSGATANIMSEAVSRTFAEMFDRDLATLISGISPASGLQQTALTQYNDLLSGITQTKDKKSDATMTAISGGLDFLKDIF